MNPCHRTLSAVLTVVAVVASVALFDRAAGAATDRSVSAERWARAVCTALSDLLETSAPLDQRLFTTIEDVELEDISASKAKRRLVDTSRRSVEAIDELIDHVESAGTPRISHSKQIVERYLDVLADYRELYQDLRRTVVRVRPRDHDEFVDTLVQAQEDFVAGLGVIGFDPLEELREVPELATAIDSQRPCRDLQESFRPPPAPVAPGDCVATLGDFLYDLRAVDCDDPHHGETIVVTDHPAPLGEAFPGNDALLGFVRDTCVAAFESYVGADYLSSALDFAYWTPVAETWTVGHREIVCVIADPTGVRLVGSVQGTGR